MNEENLKFKIALTLIPGVGDVLAKNLISYCGSPEGVFKEKERKLLKIPEIGPVTANAIVNHKIFEQAEAEISFIRKYKITPLFYLDKEYPARLKACSDSPLMLYYKGTADLNVSKTLGIVGTRKATGYGKYFCEKLLEDLSKQEILIVSGLAYGIDICAHKASLKNKMETVGVLAHGLNKIYPQVHKSTAEKMVKSGGLISEFMSHEELMPENFPKRNRIIAGLCDAIVVVEAGKKGGALITANIADSYNRDVFAVPGRAGDLYSEGCNNLIKSNRAALIASAADIEYFMGWDSSSSAERKGEQIAQKKLFLELKPDEKIIVDILEECGTMGVDTLCLRAGLSMGKTASVLLNLEFSGIVKTLPGKMYQLV